MSILVSILALGFIIFFHELGHFLAAKFFGVGVLEFSIGMGPRLVSKVFRNTRYSLKLLPLGGSCAMLGEDAAGTEALSKAEGKPVTEEENKEDKDEEDFGPERIVSPDGEVILDYNGVRYRAEEIPDRTFENKPSWQRFIICIAGVFQNFLLAFLLAIFVCHFSGFDVPIIVGTEASSEAGSIGLQQGDILKSISYDGKHKRSIHSFRDLSIYLYLNNQDFTEDTNIEISFRNGADGEVQTASFAPYFDEAAQKYRLGISFYSGRVAAGNAGELIMDAFHELQYNIRVVIDSLKLIFKGRVHRNEVMGPVGTVSVIGGTVEKSSQYGLFNAFLVLMELSLMLSANLGVMNLLPIPALDGGRLLFVLMEMILRRRLNPELEEKINQIGMIALLALMVLVMSNDIVNIFTGAYAKLLQ